ncbi:disulfide bond formation protein B [Salinispirillum sp. LH 10-3-1]|uniref:Disulfide bond formation protein B n=1 Tax=Salinispirillum sp. LH 10-3-1 TaxID=2952525 RepID=A0AB38YGI7_9GAMM
MFLLSTRLLNFLVAISALILILTGILYFQNRLGMAPCPLCIFQRIAFMGVALFCLAAAIHNPGARGIRIYSSLAFVSASIGAGIAARHVYLQGRPSDMMPSCGPDLSYMMQNFPLQEVFNTVFRGSGDCADLHWAFLGLTIPGWALVWFVGFMVVTGLLVWKPDAVSALQNKWAGRKLP